MQGSSVSEIDYDSLVPSESRVSLKCIDGDTSFIPIDDSHWIDIKSRISALIGEDIVKEFFCTIKCSDIKSSFITIDTPTDFLSGWIKTKFYARIHEAITDHLKSRQFFDVSFEMRFHSRSSMRVKQKIIQKTIPLNISIPVKETSTPIIEVQPKSMDSLEKFEISSILRQSFRDRFRFQMPLQPNMAVIKAFIASLYKVKVALIDSERRTAEAIKPRQVSMYLCREWLGMSYPEIGRRFGGRDHTTVLHGCNKIASCVRNNDILIIQKIIDFEALMKTYYPSCQPLSCSLDAALMKETMDGQSPSIDSVSALSLKQKFDDLVCAMFVSDKTSSS